MSLSKIIERIRKDLNDPKFSSVAKWRKANPGGKVIGYFPVYAPFELIHAAGMLPVLLAGANGFLRVNLAGGHLQGFTCSIGRSTLEMELEGLLPDFDGIVFPSTCEISRILIGVWERREPRVPVIYLHFPQNLESAHSVDYLATELVRFKNSLEKISGKSITDDAICQSFEAYNERASLLKQLDEFRRENPGKLKGSEYYLIRLSGMVVPVGEHSKILRKVIAELPSVTNRTEPGLRMLLTGAFCERPPVQMLEEIEEAGVDIVGDDLLMGQRWWTEPLPIDGEPLRTLAEHWVKNSAFSAIVHHNPDALANEIIGKVEECKADGVIVATAKFCHSAQNDGTEIVRTCERRGIPYMTMEFEEDLNIFEKFRMQVEALLEARRILPFAGTEKLRRGSK